MPDPRAKLLASAMQGGPTFGLPNPMHSMGDFYSKPPSRQPSQEQWGNRPNGDPKGAGWLGVLPRPDGGVSTEISAGVEIGGKETEIPLMVPTLEPQEVQWLLRADTSSPQFYQQMPPSIMQKATDHARQRMALGKSPFID